MEKGEKALIRSRTKKKMTIGSEDIKMEGPSWRGGHKGSVPTNLASMWGGVKERQLPKKGKKKKSTEKPKGGQNRMKMNTQGRRSNRLTRN